MNKAIKYRIYPTEEQIIMFSKTFGCCRKVYNLMLENKIKSYKENKTFGSQTPAMYKKEYPFLKEVDSLALANVQLNLQTAYKNFFRNNIISFSYIPSNFIIHIIRITCIPIYFYFYSYIKNNIT